MTCFVLLALEKDITRRVDYIWQNHSTYFWSFISPSGLVVDKIETWFQKSRLALSNLHHRYFESVHLSIEEWVYFAVLHLVHFMTVKRGL